MSDFFTKLNEETTLERNELYSVPQIIDSLSGNITKETYLLYLAEAYHHVKHTLPLLMLAGSKITEDKEWVREAFAEYISEEVGHQEWILNDIKNAGGNSEEVRNGKPKIATELMVSYAYDLVNRKNPVAFFGMVFVLEGTSVGLAVNAAESIMKSTGLKKNCFSYLFSHGSLDVGHMDFFSKTINKITNKKDQEDIIHAAKVFFKLFAEIFRQIPNNK